MLGIYFIAYLWCQITIVLSVSLLLYYATLDHKIQRYTYYQQHKLVLAAANWLARHQVHASEQPTIGYTGSSDPERLEEKESIPSVPLSDYDFFEDERLD